MPGDDISQFVVDQKSQGKTDVAPFPGVIRPCHGQAEVFIFGSIIMAALNVYADGTSHFVSRYVLQQTKAYPSPAVMLEQTILMGVMPAVQVEFLVDGKIICLGVVQKA